MLRLEHCEMHSKCQYMYVSIKQKHHEQLLSGSSAAGLMMETVVSL